MGRRRDLTHPIGAEPPVDPEEQDEFWRRVVTVYNGRCSNCGALLMSGPTTDHYGHRGRARPMRVDCPLCHNGTIDMEPRAVWPGRIQS